jgi:hypothetical protein
MTFSTWQQGRLDKSQEWDLCAQIQGCHRCACELHKDSSHLDDQGIDATIGIWRKSKAYEGKTFASG